MLIGGFIGQQLGETIVRTAAGYFVLSALAWSPSAVVVSQHTLVEQLNADPAIHGILVQLPLPAHVDAEAIINTIDPVKDVDGFHVTNAGRLATRQRAMVPCTPWGCLMLLRDRLGDLPLLKLLRLL